MKNIYYFAGDFLNIVNPPVPFLTPSDIIAFANDEFAIKDDVGIHLFDQNGNFRKCLINPNLGKLFGLATDGNHLYMISTNPNSNEKIVTKVRKYFLDFLE